MACTPFGPRAAGYNQESLSVENVPREGIVLDAQVRFNELLASLKERRFRLTHQRLKLLRLIASSDGITISERSTSQ
jgi:hypothetical protein